MVSFKFFFLVVSVWEIDTPGAWSVLDQRGMVDYQTLLNNKYGALGPVVSEKKIFYFFPHCKSLGAICCNGNHNFDTICSKI